MIATFRRSWRRIGAARAVRALMLRGVWRTTRSTRAYLRANPRRPGTLESAPGTLRAAGRIRGIGATRALGAFAVIGLAAHHDLMLLEGYFRGRFRSQPTNSGPTASISSMIRATRSARNKPSMMKAIQLQPNSHARDYETTRENGGSAGRSSRPGPPAGNGRLRKSSPGAAHPGSVSRSARPPGA